MQLFVVFYGNLICFYIRIGSADNQTSRQLSGIFFSSSLVTAMMRLCRFRCDPGLFPIRDTSIDRCSSSLEVFS